MWTQGGQQSSQRCIALLNRTGRDRVRAVLVLLFHLVVLLPTTAASSSLRAKTHNQGHAAQSLAATVPDELTPAAFTAQASTGALDLSVSSIDTRTLREQPQRHPHRPHQLRHQRHQHPQPASGCPLPNATLHLAHRRLSPDPIQPGALYGPVIRVVAMVPGLPMPWTKWWEHDWLFDLLSMTGLPFTFEPPTAATKLQPKSLTLLVGMMGPTFHTWWSSWWGLSETPGTNEFRDAFPRRYQEAGMDYGVMHLSDEDVDPNTTKTYRFSHCKFILRNYYAPHLPQEEQAKVQVFGLGYRNGFWRNYDGRDPLHITIAARPYAWTFAGSFDGGHSGRDKVLEMFTQVTPHKLHRVSGFNAKDALGPEDYRTMLLQSIFVLCPLGHVNIDSFRVYETMEAGAIPVTLSENPKAPDLPGGYWQYVFGADEAPVPFLAARTWEQALEQMQALLEDRPALEAKRKQVQALLEDRQALLEDRQALLEDRQALLEDRQALLEDRQALKAKRQQARATVATAQPC